MSSALYEDNIAGRLDRLPLTSVQWKLWFLHEICWILGSVGLGTATFVLSSIGTEFNLTSTTKGLVATFSFLGMFVGAGLSGYLGDKYGRKKLLIAGILIWSLASFGLAWTPNITSMWVFRFFLGLGMGAQFPMTQSMLSELFPAKDRGKAICLMEGGFPLACILAGLISWVVLANFDWRVVFLIQALGGLCIFMVISMIPESARWYESVGQLDKAKEIVAAMEEKVKKITGKPLPPIPAPVVETKDYSDKSKFLQLFEKGQTKKTLTLWTLWFCVLFGFYGLNTWISALLVSNGFSVVKSTGFVLLMYLPAIPGYLAATYLVEKVGRKKMIFSYLLLAAVFCYFYGQSNSMTEIFIFGCFMQFFMFGMWSLIYTYAVEVFPTRIRSTGAGTTSSAGRAGALLAPTLFGMLLPFIGNSGVFNVGAALFVLGGTLTLIFGVETKGKRLEEIHSL